MDVEWREAACPAGTEGDWWRAAAEAIEMDSVNTLNGFTFQPQALA